MFGIEKEDDVEIERNGGRLRRVKQARKGRGKHRKERRGLQQCWDSPLG